MTTRIGTSYFVSREAAFAHYALQGEDESFVSDRIADGLVKIGKPAILFGERLLVIDDGRRYAIEYEERRPAYDDHFAVVDRDFPHVIKERKLMDPDTALREIRTLLAAERFDDIMDTERLHDLVRGLDEWLTKGGTLPLAWDRDRKV